MDRAEGDHPKEAKDQFDFIDIEIPISPMSGPREAEEQLVVTLGWFRYYSLQTLSATMANRSA